MGVIGKAGAGLAALAVMTMAAAPAMADGRHDRDRGRHQARGDKDDDAVGGFVLGALIAGGLVAALTGKKKAPRPLPEDVAFVPVAASAAGPGVLPAQADQEAAVNACVASAEDEARRHFPVAQVAGVTAVEPVGQGFAVMGDVLVRLSYRQAGEKHGFRCSVDAEAVNGVTIERLPTPTA
jgi:hypothetical protein